MPRPLHSLVTLSRLALEAEAGFEVSVDSESAGTISPGLVRAHRMEGFLLRHRETLGLPPSLTEALSANILPRAQQSLSQWASSLTVSRIFAGAGIDHLIFKGRALVSQTAAEDDGRGGGDVDILIHPSSVPQAHSLLTAQGFTSLYALQPRTRLGWAFICYRNRELPFQSPYGEVDLHWRIAPDDSLMPKTATLCERAVMVGEPGQEIPTLDPRDALVACGLHFYLDYAVALRRLIDFVRLARQWSDAQSLALPRPTRQLVADVSGLCRMLFGPRLPQLPEEEHAEPSNVGYLYTLFSRGQGGYDYRRIPGTGSERLLRQFRHLRRYVGPLPLIARLVARGLLWFPPTSQSPSGVGIPRGFVLQVGRILRGEFESGI